MVKIEIQNINGIFSCPQSQFVTMMRQVFATGTAIYLSPPFIQHSIPSFTQLKSKRQSLQGNCLVTQFHSEKFYRFLHSLLPLALLFLTSIMMDANEKNCQEKSKICSVYIVTFVTFLPKYCSLKVFTDRKNLDVSCQLVKKFLDFPLWENRIAMFK